MKIGTRIKIVFGSGLDSNQQGKVIAPFNWREEEGAYRPPDKKQAPVLLDDGRKIYMYKNRLIIL